MLCQGFLKKSCNTRTKHEPWKDLYYCVSVFWLILQFLCFVCVRHSLDMWSSPSRWPCGLNRTCANGWRNTVPISTRSTATPSNSTTSQVRPDTRTVAVADDGHRELSSGAGYIQATRHVELQELQPCVQNLRLTNLGGLNPYLFFLIDLSLIAETITCIAT